MEVFFIPILQMLKLRLRISGELKDHVHLLGKEEDIQNQQLKQN